MKLGRTVAIFLATIGMLASLSGTAVAVQPFLGTYTGNTEDKGENVELVVKRKGDGKLYVTKFKVTQGKCGVTKFTTANNPGIMPARVKYDDGTRKFRIVRKMAGIVVFKVTGHWLEDNATEIEGFYSQVACDADKDEWSVIATI